MPYTILEHTADVRLLVEGPTLAELFREALRGMMELMKPEGAQALPGSGFPTEVAGPLRPGAQPEVAAPLEAGARGAEQTAERRRRICIESPSATALLVDFLNEALCLAHSHREMYEVAGIEVDREAAAAEGKGPQPEVAAPLEPGAQPRVAVLLNAGARVRAELARRPVDGFGEDVKAVTYHEAEIRRNAAGGFETRLVFDI